MEDNKHSQCSSYSFKSSMHRQNPIFLHLLCASFSPPLQKRGVYKDNNSASLIKCMVYKDNSTDYSLRPKNRRHSHFTRSQTRLTLTKYIKNILIFIIHNQYHQIDRRIYFHNKLIWRYKCCTYFLQIQSKLIKFDLHASHNDLYFGTEGVCAQLTKTVVQNICRQAIIQHVQNELPPQRLYAYVYHLLYLQENNNPWSVKMDYARKI